MLTADHGFVGPSASLADSCLGAAPAGLNSSASPGGSRLVRGGLAAVDVRDFASDLGIHPDFSAGVLDGQ